MDNRWFSEDRKLPKADQARAIEESKKALASSTLLIRRLKQILEAEIKKTYATEEDYAGTDWERKVLSMFARRSALKDIIKILP